MPLKNSAMSAACLTEKTLNDASANIAAAAPTDEIGDQTIAPSTKVTNRERPKPSRRCRLFLPLPAVSPVPAVSALSPDAANHHRLRLRVPTRRWLLGRWARPESGLACLAFRRNSGADASSSDGGSADSRGAGCDGADRNCSPGGRRVSFAVETSGTTGLSNANGEPGPSS